MNKKKDQQKLIIIGFMWFGIGLVLIGIVGLILSQEPHFKITKDECHNETIWSEECVPYIILLYFTNSQTSFEKKKEFDKNLESLINKELIRRISGDIDCFQSNLGNEQRCNKVEVDEIELKDYIKVICEVSQTKCGDKIEVPIDVAIDYDRNKIMKVDLVSCNNSCSLTNLTSSISKKDLTKEWLDENCECINTCTSEYQTSWSIFKYNTNKCFGVFPNFPSENYKHGWYCKKYKCFENYEVETWSQIK